MNPRSDIPTTACSLLVLALWIVASCTTITSAAPMQGQIVVDEARPQWFGYHESGPFFLCGPGDPEGFLYRGMRNVDGTRNGDQMQLINKLQQNGGNCIYLMAVRTHGGDAGADHRKAPAVYPDARHNPWREGDPAEGLNTAILDQWETWFTAMDDNGITIFFFLYDDAIQIGGNLGWPLDKDGNLHPSEKAFIESLVNRFEHHRHLIWCVMEEAQEMGPQWKRHTSEIAEVIRESDEHSHPIASHQLSGSVFYHPSDPNIDQFAIQTDKRKAGTPATLHRWLVGIWKEAGGRYNLNASEDALHGQLCLDGNWDAVRQRNWAAAMAGAYVMVIGMDIANTPATALQDCRRLQQFFEATDFYRMAPHDELRHGDTQYVLASPRRSYILYALHPSSDLGLKDMAAGTYQFRWVDCISGNIVEQTDVHLGAGDQTWPKPRGIGDEVAIYISRDHATSQPQNQ